VSLPLGMSSEQINSFDVYQFPAGAEPELPSKGSAAIMQNAAITAGGMLFQSVNGADRFEKMPELGEHYYVGLVSRTGSPDTLRTNVLHIAALKASIVRNQEVFNGEDELVYSNPNLSADAKGVDSHTVHTLLPEQNATEAGPTGIVHNTIGVGVQVTPAVPEGFHPELWVKIFDPDNYADDEFDINDDGHQNAEDNYIGVLGEVAPEAGEVGAGLGVGVTFSSDAGVLGDLSNRSIRDAMTEEHFWSIQVVSGHESNEENDGDIADVSFDQWFAHVSNDITLGYSYGETFLGPSVVYTEEVRDLMETNNNSDFRSPGPIIVTATPPTRQLFVALS